MSETNKDPDVQGLINIVQSVVTSPAVANTVKRIAEIRMQIFDLQEELDRLEKELPGYIETVIITPSKES